MVRGVIFDLDGTLGDTLPVCYQAFRAVLRRRLGRDFADRRIHALFGPSEEGIFERLCPDDPEAATEEYLEVYREAHARCPTPFEGIRETLESLRSRRVELAVVTGKGRRSAAVSLDVLGLGEYFPVVEAGSRSGGVKVRCMRSVLGRWGLPPGAVVGVGDAPSDVRAARTVHIGSAAAAWAPGADPQGLAACGPDQVFEEVREFSRWLEGAASNSRQ